MIASVVQDETPERLRFRVQYQPTKNDAIAFVDVGCNSLAGLYRVIYNLAGKERSIGTYHMFIAHQTLPNGDVIEFNGAGEFTKAIRDEKGTTTTVITAPLADLMEKGSAARMPRKLYVVESINKSTWRKGYEFAIH